ncbi:hypothetical protein [Kitasatospora sp. NPDC059599]|uniref:hypothetical protein n=1 Tax=Kitasatospora sp. NPDC059599 TaxID=3346880 RepID=UPI0036A5BA78
MDGHPDPRQVIASLLDDQRFLTACAARDMGTVFRLLNSRGVSTRRLAAAADITQGRLYDYLNGETRVSRIALARTHIQCGDLDAAVSVGTDLLATSPTLGSVRVVNQLDDLAELLGRYCDYSPVQEYLARFDEASRTRVLLLADIIPEPRGGSS